MKKKKISLYGASGHAKVIVECVLSQNNYQVDCLFDDDENITTLLGFKVRHTSQLTQAKHNNVLFISIGNNSIRAKIVEKFKHNFNFSDPIVHKTASIAQSVIIGKGSVIMPNTVINPDTKIGKHSIINSGAVVEHDCVVEEFCHISPNATLAGGVRIGSGTHIGMGAQIIPEIKIGKWATIGAGAVIIRDVPDGAKIVGNPGTFI